MSNQNEVLEWNIRTLLKLHSNPEQFIKTLQNEAIDNAFVETSEQLNIIFGEISKIYERLGNEYDKRLTELENGVDSGFLETASELAELRAQVVKINKVLEDNHLIEDAE